MDNSIGDDLELSDQTNERISDPFPTASFTREWKFPRASNMLLVNAQKAVRLEYLDCSKWKRLKCRNVSLFAEQQRGTVYVVHVGSSVEFDWTWEVQSHSNQGH